jgi:PIN domain nuclease of toxin-antitoxin system
LVEKGRLPPIYYEDVVLSAHDPNLDVELLPIDKDVALAVERIPRDVVPDLPDRIIAATALTHNLPLVTADHKIRALRIPTIW